MDRYLYYESLKELAREKRKQHNVKTDAFGLREIRKIYKKEGVKIDLWPLPSKIKAVYMCDDGDFSVAIQRKLPDEPKLFALAHELKHHYEDQEFINSGAIHCGEYNRNEPIEIGAEIFAAEFIYPQCEFSEDIKNLNISMWRPEDIVRLKTGCKAKVSYQFLQKRLCRLGLISYDQFKGVKFKKLEEHLCGTPFYKRKKTNVIN